MQKPKMKITQEILDRLPEMHKAIARYLINKKELVLVNDLSSEGRISSHIVSEDEQNISTVRGNF